MPSSRSEPKSPDIYSATKVSAPQPTVGQDTFYVPGYPISLRQFVGYEVGNCALSPLAGRSDYHRPCPETNSVARPGSASDAPQQLLRLLLLTISCRGHSQGQQLRLTAHHHPRPEDCVLRRFWHGLWGLGQYSPPKTRLAHSRICRLPVPVDATQLLTILHQHRPYLVQHAQVYPTLKSAMDRAVVGEGFGQIVPLTAASHAENNRIQSRSRVDAFSARVFGWVAVLNNRLYSAPQFIWCLPNRWQCFRFLSFLCHLRLLSLGLTDGLSAKLCVLR